MIGVSRRTFATLVAAATIFVLSTGAVAAADPDSRASAGDGSSGASVTLGAKSDLVRPGRVQLDHGGGLHLPATDVESAPLTGGATASDVGVALGIWVLVFLAGALASLGYMTRRSRL